MSGASEQTVRASDERCGAKERANQRHIFTVPFQLNLSPDDDASSYPREVEEEEEDEEEEEEEEDDGK